MSTNPHKSPRRRKLKSAHRHCQSPDQLHEWIEQHTQLKIPRVAVCANHQAPFEYIRSAYFEPARDLVVWAPRGGGKTRLAALATLLDLLHKPGCAVRILGGSLEQSLRMWEHLLPDLESLAKSDLEKPRAAGKRIQLKNGSSAAVLTQSQRAVRGLRVQKLRCDEIELFKPDIWEAAQLVTRSRDNAVGAVEAISTFHHAAGLMHSVLSRAEIAGTRIIRWCLLEVLEKCPPSRDCATCPLWEECQGVAKTKCDGFIRIDDAIAMKFRVSKQTWETEMLCKRPSVAGCVFPSFEPAIHVRELIHSRESLGEVSLAIDFGFHNPFVCLWIADDGARCFVIDEYVQSGRVVEEHIQEIQSRPWGKPRHISCDPAGGARNDQTAESNVQCLKRHEYQVHRKRSRIVDGIELIRAALRPAAGEPTLFVHPRCTRLIAALQQYRYPLEGGELPLKDGTHDHLIDSLRYFYVNRDGKKMKLHSRRY